MNPLFFIVLPFVGGLASLLLGRISATASRVAALLGNLGCLALALAFWRNGNFPAELNLPWIPALGASFALRLDGLSLPFLALSGLLGAVAVVASWKGITRGVPSFHLNVSFALAGINGVFLASDLFLFAFMWELMLIPVFFLIDIWGQEGSHRAAVKFFIFTQAGGLLMIAAIAGLYAFHGQATGQWTFSHSRLVGFAVPSTLQFILMLGFFAGFAVKLPAFGLHGWQPDAYSAAPTGATVLLAGLLSKTAGYGLLRFAIPLFPDATSAIAPVAMWLGVAGILYGGLMALGQSDMKRLVAYSSLSHLGFVLVGVYSMQEAGRTGAMIQLISHGVSTGALFLLLGALRERTGTTELDRLGGLAAKLPRMGAFGLVLSLALLGLPGLGNFVGEFLVLFGAFKSDVAVAVVAGFGLIIAMAYSLRMFQLAFHGEAAPRPQMADLSFIETGTLGALVAVLLWIGLYPAGVTSIFSKTLSSLFGGIAP